MRLTMTAIFMAAAMVVATPVFAELQNVEVGGSLRIRGNYYTPEANLATFANEDAAANNAHVEQRTTISVSADFTDGVSTYIELDNYGTFGDGDFRGTADAFSGGELSLYQAYIQADDAFDYPLMLRIGRQEIQLGSEWLVGNNDTGSNFQGLSFDAVRATYVAEDVGSLTLVWAKLVETASIAGPSTGDDDDTDLYVVYGSYTGMEDITIDAYYILARIATVASSAVDDLATFGARVAADYMGFDIEAEIAFQTGDAETVSTTAEFDGTAFNVEVGYVFDMDYQPRVYVGFASFDGSSGGDVGFQRLFSDWEYGEFLDGGDLVNVTIIRVGGSAQLTESIDVAIAAALYTVDEEVTAAADDALGSEVALYANYAYSEDLTISVGYAHYFADDGSGEGNFVLGNGSTPLGNGTPGSAPDDDADYLFFETSISF